MTITKDTITESFELVMNFMDKLPDDARIISIYIFNSVRIQLFGDFDFRAFSQAAGVPVRKERGDSGTIHLYADLFGCIATKALYPGSPEYERELDL